MEQYIPKSAVVAEINRVLNSYDPNEITSGRYALVNLRDFIDTLEVKEETEWNEASIKPPFVETMDGNKYSEPVLCRDKFENYCIAQYVRWHTGYCGWYDSEEEVCITHWKELKAQKGE